MVESYFHQTIDGESRAVSKNVLTLDEAHKKKVMLVYKNFEQNMDLFAPNC